MSNIQTLIDDVTQKLSNQSNQNSNHDPFPIETTYKKQVKIRTANIVQQAKFITEEKIKSVVNSYKVIKKWAYILHDKDTNKDGTPKEPHYHIVLSINPAVDIERVAEWFGVPTNLIGIPKGSKGKYGINAFLDCSKYLTHEDEKQQEQGKHHYSDDEVKCNFEFRDEIDTYEVKRLTFNNNQSMFGNNAISEKTKNLRVKVLKGELKLSDIDNDDYVIDINQLNLCRREYLRKHAVIPKFRTNYYIHGGSGSGKSFASRALAKSIFDPYNRLKDEEVFFVTGQGKAMFQGYDGQPVIIFDDLRATALLKYYDGNPGAIFNLFDPVPSTSEQNIKFGSIKLTHYVAIVNSIENFEEFSKNICYKIEKYQDTPEPDKQLWRRFPFWFWLSSDGKQTYDFFVSRQFFNPDEPNYKAYDCFRKMGVRYGLLKAGIDFGMDSVEYNNVRLAHFDKAIEFYRLTKDKFEQSGNVLTLEQKQKLFIDIAEEEKQKSVANLVFDTVDFSEDIDNEILDLKAMEEKALLDYYKVQRKLAEINDLKRRKLAEFDLLAQQEQENIDNEINAITEDTRDMEVD